MGGRRSNKLAAAMHCTLWGGKGSSLERTLAFFVVFRSINKGKGKAGDELDGHQERTGTKRQG